VSDLDRIVAFLDEIGIEVAAADAAESFLPGVRVDRGRLLVDAERLQWPGDVLHEAGHLALVPERLRSQASDDVVVPDVAMGDVEPAAMLWSYAAAVHIGLDPATVFHEGGYRGRGPALLRTYSAGGYPGIAVLARLGLADATFPRMLRWLAP
jgi:hypothetical protein